jgi:hypothetical protein
MQKGSSVSGTVMLSDEQILGMDEGLELGNVTGGAAAGQTAAANGSTGRAEADPLASSSTAAAPHTGDFGSKSSFDDDVMAGNGAAVAARLAQLNGERAAPQSGTQASDAAMASNGPGETSLTGEAPFTGDFASEPAWLKTLETQPAAAAEARQWRDAARDISSIDAAYFSAEPGARSGLAERLYQSDPAAFRAMVAESARMLATRDPQGLAELARQLGMPEAAAPLRPRSISQAARQAAESPAAPAMATAQQQHAQPHTIPGAQADSHPNAQLDNGSSGRRAASGEVAQQPAPTTAPQFPAESYRAFEASTNEDVGRRMHEAIDRTLASTLPQGIAEGARRRIGEDIFREVHASLAGDRELSQRVGETLRDWRFDASSREQVVALLTGRARAVLPEVARRVVSEWTSSVLASDRARVARIDAAATRRDITGGRLPEPVSSSTLRPREVDYRRLSDEQILEM